VADPAPFEKSALLDVDGAALYVGPEVERWVDDDGESGE
jgi:hypothetical protein